MKRTIAIDLPALLQGNLHHVNIPLVYGTLDKIKGLKNVELITSEEDWQILYGNEDGSFISEISMFLSEFRMVRHSKSEKKTDLTYTPDIVSGLDPVLADAVYLQLCIIHTVGDTPEKVTFIGFIPRFSETFLLSTIRDKKARVHRTFILSSEDEVDAWIKSWKPKLSQLKHQANASKSVMGIVSPFTSLYKKGVTYADSLLQQAYMDSQDEEEFPHYLYTWDPEAGTFIEFRHENHHDDSHHDYHGRDMQKSEFNNVPKYIREKYHR